MLVVEAVRNGEIQRVSEEDCSFFESAHMHLRRTAEIRTHTTHISLCEYAYEENHGKGRTDAGGRVNPI